MSIVEFQANVEDGNIIIPEEYKQELTSVSAVKIILLKQPQKQAKRFDFMDELVQNPRIAKLKP
ncbi:MAG: hypothetical protein HC903_30095 [Methylacidiphilales bacterium]|nr:hypothetical protein [Candidatus Methylacidiphilales bacterium]